MGNGPNIREFIEFKNKADKFFKVVEHWKTRMLFESINDKDFFFFIFGDENDGYVLCFFFADGYLEDK